MGVRSVILAVALGPLLAARIGRPTTKAPAGRFGRLMKQRFTDKADAGYD